MCDGFAMYNRRINGLEAAGECAVVSTTELNKLRGDLADLQLELQKARNQASFWKLRYLAANRDLEWVWQYIGEHCQECSGRPKE